MKPAPSGYILLLSLLISTLSVIIVTYITYRGTVYVPYMNIIQKREKAKWLAFSGLQLAISQLSHMHEQPQAETPEKKVTEKEANKNESGELLRNLVPMLGRWQTLVLKKSIEGVDATIQICLTCEEGKININNLYDFKKHAFIKGPGHADAQKLLQSLLTVLQKSTKSTDLFKSFENFLRSRQYKLQDTTQLLAIPGFEVFQNRIWYEPPQGKIEAKAASETEFYLNDLFTIWSTGNTISPWLFSDSLKGVLQMKRVAQYTQDEMKQILQEQTKGIGQTSDWAKEWDTRMGTWNEKSYKQLIDSVKPYLAPRVVPQFFSVFVQAMFAGITQRLCALVERAEVPSSDSVNMQQTKKTERNERTHGQSVHKKSQFVCTIKKLYWL